MYVPKKTETVNIDLLITGDHLEASFHTVVFGGDQLTAKRARGSQMIRSNSITSSHKISSLLSIAEDWHAKLCFLEVSEKIVSGIFMILPWGCVFPWEIF